MDIDPDHTHALARDLRLAATDTDLTVTPWPLIDDSFPATSHLARSITAALDAVARRSSTISTHLSALSDDADTFVTSVIDADRSLGRTWEATL